ncbi:hypothetical protein EIN_122310 [Entamoeba invadens IP1]|uniref:Uncharacterized protein n=1 Tax=Entamoeba invadens IP1 TaxID=370355 RepID=A0A0A1UB40_ENTIV|nr:hypothetical protein EIN_122310 [Entamoeba invadens IP1]ELP92320.1 hypothetical protein EIN_122310 [Entamoeba invadens IP1]|eukprot:XP_004259091.1 hypothetical protein EIN_122310 [Entamoeba invadens IP1]
MYYCCITFILHLNNFDCELLFICLYTQHQHYNTDELIAVHVLFTPILPLSTRFWYPLLSLFSIKSLLLLLLLIFRLLFWCVSRLVFCLWHLCCLQFLCDLMNHKTTHITSYFLCFDYKNPLLLC